MKHLQLGFLSMLVRVTVNYTKLPQGGYSDLIVSPEDV